MHYEALVENGRKLLPKFKSFTGFYLAGGTALALQLGHRISVDFDFFSEKPIHKSLLPFAEKTFSGGKFDVRVNNADELTFFIDGVKITFLYYSFSLLFPLAEFEGINLADSREIGVMKAYTIGRRASFKDYVDLYFILASGIFSLQDIVENGERKYKDAFNAKLFLEQLVYFEDIADAEMVWLKNKINLADMKKFFQERVKEIKL